MIERSYQDSIDQALMLELAHREPGENLHVIDLPYRLSSWALAEPENARLWFDMAGRLQAWAVLQTPFWSIDYVIHRAGDRVLHGRVLDWAVARAQALYDNPVYGRPAWYVSVLAGRSGRMADLAARGFADQANAPVDPWSKVLMTRPAEQAEVVDPLPPGYRLRPLDNPGDVSGYVALHQAAFGSKNMTETWREQVIRQPAYRPELNLAVETPGGDLAAFCIGWFDPIGYAGRPGGQVEPLGVHPDHRGLGLAKAVLGECIRRMIELGAKEIYVETDNYRDEAFRLYESAGFRVLHPVNVFRREILEDLSPSSA